MNYFNESKIKFGRTLRKLLILFLRDEIFDAFFHSIINLICELRHTFFINKRLRQKYLRKQKYLNKKNKNKKKKKQTKKTTTTTKENKKKIKPEKNRVSIAGHLTCILLQYAWYSYFTGA